MSTDIEFLKWDSDFMHLKVGKIFLDKKYIEETSTLKIMAKNENYDLVYVFTAENNFLDASLLNESFKLVDQKIVYSVHIDERNFSDLSDIESINQDFLSQEDINNIYHLAYMSGEFSRFRLDEKLPKNYFYKLYTTWADKSLNRIIAHKTFVFRERNKIVGFATVKINQDQNYAEIGLIAVEPQQRGKKIGKKLVEKCLKEAKINNVSSLKIPTQLSNQNACNFYEKMGFQKESITNIYHLWN